MGNTLVKITDDEMTLLQRMISPRNREIAALSTATVEDADRFGTIKFPDTCSAGTNDVYIPDAILQTQGFRFTIIVPPAYTSNIRVHYGADTSQGVDYGWELPCDVTGNQNTAWEVICSNGEISVVGLDTSSYWGA